MWGKYIPKLMYKMFGPDLLISTQEQCCTVSADSSAFSSGQETKYQITKYAPYRQIFSLCVLLFQALFTNHILITNSTFTLHLVSILCVSE